MGKPDTTGRMVFFHLDKLQEGDSVVVEDLSGNPYEYEVSEVFVVEPDAEWAIDPVRGRDMVASGTSAGRGDPHNRQSRPCVMGK